jgi:ribosomal protein S18 acetylase RimI-like enzyme
VRWATEADIPELVRLRRVMFEAMGVPCGSADDDASAAAFARGLPTGEFFAAVVDGTDHVAACGVGMTALRLPGPGNPSGRVGYIKSMVTDERDRRRGLARVVLAALLERFAADGTAVVELHATAVGEPLYRSMGFVAPGTPALRRVARE